MLNTYKTTNLTASAFLAYSGFELVGKIKMENKRNMFLFDDSGGIQDFMRDYNIGRARVEPGMFHRIINNLKAIPNFNYEDTL